MSKILAATAVFCFASGAYSPLLPSNLQEQSSSPASEEPLTRIRLSELEEGSTLEIFAGKSLLITSENPLARVSLADPEIASAMVISPTQVLIQGKAPGQVTLFIWNQQEEALSVELVVVVDVEKLQKTVLQLFPEEEIEIGRYDAAIVLKGSVSSEKVLGQVRALATAETENLVDFLEVEQKGEVLLQVRFAEVDRAAVQELGVNIFSTGAINTPGVITTQQFGGTSGNVGATPPGTEPGDVQGSSVVAGGIGNPLEGIPSIFGLTDLLNVFIFRPDLNLGTAIRALQQQNLLQILAEPNLLAMDGQEASFLAGGEFPFPVVQGGTNFSSVTIQFKEFGIRLSFTPTVLKDDRIRLKVSPEVSALDFSNALTISGFLVPALSTRKATTEVELNDGQSFAVAGLIDNRLTEIASKVPVLGDIPILGSLFRSRARNQSNTELLVVVTPRLVRKLGPDEMLAVPTFPGQFLDKERFDGKVGEVPPEKEKKKKKPGQ